MDQDKMVDEIEKRIATTDPKVLGEAILEIWRDAEIKNLNEEQRAKVVGAAIFQKLTGKMTDTLNAESEDVEQLFDEFIGMQKSEYTKRGYRIGLRIWLDWCKREGVHPLLAKVRDADLFAATAEGSPSTINHAVIACGSWYSMLIRWEKISHTPFNRVKKRITEKRPIVFPTEEEIGIILTHVKHFESIQPGGPRGSSNEVLHAAFVVMAFRGFRVGSLPGLKVLLGGRFSTKSKGKHWTGQLGEEVATVLKPLGEHPFGGTTQQKLAAAVKARMQTLFKMGVIAAPYSSHDFRHYFASMHYAKHKDIRLISELLNHADIGITSTYLHGILGIEN